MPLTRQVKAVISNPIGFPVPPINSLGEGEVAPSLDDVYEGIYFSFEVEFILYEIFGESDEILFPNSTIIELNSYSSGLINGLSASKISNNTIKIEGSANNVFTDAYYKFLFSDGTVRIDKPTVKDYLALVEWSIPTKRIETISHVLNINVMDIDYMENEDLVKNYSHEVYWKLEPAIEQFRKVLAGGVY